MCLGFLSDGSGGGGLCVAMPLARVSGCANRNGSCSSALVNPLHHSHTEAVAMMLEVTAHDPQP